MTNASKSRWGFHSCNHEHYRKLKRLNFLVLEARRRDAALTRWDRKLPKNRIIWKYIARGIKEKVGMMPEPKVMECYNTTYSQIEQDYQNARHPVAEEAAVKPLIFSVEQVDAWLAKFEAWYAE